MSERLGKQQGMAGHCRYWHRYFIRKNRGNSDDNLIIKKEEKKGRFVFPISRFDSSECKALLNYYKAIRLIYVKDNGNWYELIVLKDKTRGQQICCAGKSHTHKAIWLSANGYSE